MAGTMRPGMMTVNDANVSMESGLDGRNNRGQSHRSLPCMRVSMESGLDGRNNPPCCRPSRRRRGVSMESGLDGRNNMFII